MICLAAAALPMSPEASASSHCGLEKHDRTLIDGAKEHFLDVRQQVVCSILLHTAMNIKHSSLQLEGKSKAATWTAAKAARRQSSLEACGSRPAGHCMRHPDRWFTAAHKTSWTPCRRGEKGRRHRLNNGGLMTKIERAGISTFNPMLRKRRGQHLLDLAESPASRGSGTGKKKKLGLIANSLQTTELIQLRTDTHTHKVDPSCPHLSDWAGPPWARLFGWGLMIG